MIITSGPTYQGASTLFAAVEDDLEWSRTLITGVASFGRFGGAIFGPFEGFMVDRYGPGRMALIGIVLGGIGFILLSRINGPVPYFATYFLITTGFSMGGFMPSMTAVNSWLPKRRATGMAIVLAGSSLGAFVVPLMAWGITAHGWRPTVAVIGGVSIFVAPFIARIFSAKSMPRQNTFAHPTSNNFNYSSNDFTAKQAIRTRAFWALSMTHMLGNMALAGVSAHAVLHLTDIGLSLSRAASIITIIGVASLCGQITSGIFGDRVNKRLVIAFLYASQGCAIILLAGVSNYTEAAIFGVVWGTSVGARPPMFHAMRGEYFGQRAFGTIMGMVSLPMAIGMTAVPVLLGVAFDIQETYRWAFLILAATSLIAGLMILSATRPAHPNGHQDVSPVV